MEPFYVCLRIFFVDLFNLALRKLPWKLLFNTAAQQVCQPQNMIVKLVIVFDVGVVVPLQMVGRLLQRQVQMHLHAGLHVGQRPILRVGPTEKCRDLIRIGIPLCRRLIDLSFVA